MNVLLALVAALKTLPKSKERSFILAALRTLIAQLKASRETGNTLEAVAEVVRDPNPPKGPISTTKKQPPPPPAPAPAPVIDPPPPRPQPAPPPKTALQIQATQTARDLRSKQIQHGMPKAKKYFDVSKVKRLQRLLNETDDGKPGPATFMAMARVGVDDIPIVMFWPRRSTLTTVDEYRQDLLQLAEIALSAGQNNRARLVAESAAREQGQGGVVRVRGVLKRSPTTVKVKSEAKTMPPHIAKAVNDAMSSNDRAVMHQFAGRINKKWPVIASRLRSHADLVRAG